MSRCSRRPDLIALLNHFRGSAALSPPAPGEADPPGFGPDLVQVKGQATAKRSLEIVAAGGHNLLMNGPPGAGQSLPAACLPGSSPSCRLRERSEEGRGGQEGVRKCRSRGEP